MFNMQKIGRKIATLRKEKNMTQMELADRLGISFQAVSNWERGNSMPDIAKLPELAEIFEVSVDELLGEKSVLVEAAIDERMAECVENGTFSAAEMESVLPLLKPSQVSDLVQIAEEFENFDVDGIVKFLPFLGERDVKEFAGKAMEKRENVCAFLPFMSDSDVREFAEQAMEKGENINGYLPFMSNSDVKEFAEQAMEKGENINGYLPFMSDKDVKEYAMRAAEKGENIQGFLPFMAEKDVKELALKVLKSKR